MAGSLVTNYLKQGTAASRPASPTAATDTVSLYFSNDTEVLSFYDWTDGAWQDVATFAASEGVVTPQGRLTLTSATPVLITDTTGAGTIYYALYTGNMVPIYDGTVWANKTFTELSQALTDNTKSPAAAANNSNYDMFVWNDSGTMRCTRGPAWTSDTGRGTGAGTTELERVNGRWMNKIAITNGPGAQRGTYVGTIRTNGTATTDMIMEPTAALGGTANVLGVWNMYNRVRTIARNTDSTDSWNYTTLTWRQRNNNTNSRISFVVGLPESGAFEAYSGIFTTNNNAAAVLRAIAINYDSTSAPSKSYSGITGVVQTATAGAGATAHATLSKVPGIGFRFIMPMEISAATGTSSWFGDNGVDEFNAYTTLSFMM